MSQKEDALYSAGSSFTQLSLSTANLSTQMKMVILVGMMMSWISLFLTVCGQCLQGHQYVILMAKKMQKMLRQKKRLHLNRHRNALNPGFFEE
jgi:hypothetical protein